MRQAEVFYKEVLAGILTEKDDGMFFFKYEDEYIVNYPEQFITFTMPVRKDPYSSAELFSVFEGLIPEGWLLNIVIQNWKINPNDKMELLLTCCNNCIGAISIKRI